MWGAIGDLVRGTYQEVSVFVYYYCTARACAQWDTCVQMLEELWREDSESKRDLSYACVCSCLFRSLDLLHVCHGSELGG